LNACKKKICFTSCEAILNSMEQKEEFIKWIPLSEERIKKYETAIETAKDQMGNSTNSIKMIVLQFGYILDLTIRLEHLHIIEATKCISRLEGTEIPKSISNIIQKHRDEINIFIKS